MSQADFSDILDGDSPDRIEKHYIRHGYDKWREASWYKRWHVPGGMILEPGFLTNPPEPGSREILVLMQNAWIRRLHPIYGRLGVWPRESWLWATEGCRTGERLKFLMDRDDVWMDDATPVVAIGQSGIKHPADPGYVKSMVARLAPKLIVTCGESAKGVLRDIGWKGRWFGMAHPAHRILTNEYFRICEGVIESGGFQRCSVIQDRGRVRVV